ncbi:hypothetical protein Pflav_049790 [Phytohabitans flavus]|uniref:SUF system FeS cluster assembly SufBD core domain-containing protein n=1 Tax=Phytohabitans flavus TaxID=1076124 RepID=A0A6F8XXP8_9ACTN|nr:hypothetical protein Pflav_049790 [Phytohabitans flavus]
MTDTLAAPPPKTKSQALRSYDVADFPNLTGLEEEWRFTPLKRLRGLTGELVGGSAPTIGYRELPAGVAVSALDKSDPRVGSVLTPFDRISALAYGRSAAASLISVEPETVLEQAAVLTLAGTGAETPSFGHTFLEVGRFAEATIVLEQTGSVTLADNVEVAVADGAKLTLVTLADWAADAVQAQHIRFRLGRDARVTHIQVTLGGDLVRQFTSVEYTGRGGEAELYGLYFATELPADPASGLPRASTSSTASLSITACPTAAATWGTEGRSRARARTPCGSATC